jgi:acyl dehydratase
MALDPKFIGKKYGPYRYQVGLEKVREFAYAVAGGVPSIAMATPPEGLNPLLYDEKAAQAGPYGSVIAFPTFAVTFAIAPFAAAVSDPELGIDLLMVVHGEQELELLGVIKPGDVYSTTGTISQIYEKAHRDFMVVVSESKNQRGELVVRGAWTAVVRT